MTLPTSKVTGLSCASPYATNVPLTAQKTFDLYDKSVLVTKRLDRLLQLAVARV
jgi:hypothetical protein